MKLKKEKIGISVRIPLLGRWVVVNEENKGLLIANGLFQFFEPEKELQEVKKTNQLKNKKPDKNDNEVSEKRTERNSDNGDGKSDNE